MVVVHLVDVMANLGKVALAQFELFGERVGHSHLPTQVMYDKFFYSS
jgi:hypothetical protein